MRKCSAFKAFSKKKYLADLVLRAEDKFNCGITGLRKAEKMSMSTSTTDENIEAIKKMILDNRRITIRRRADDVGISFGSCEAIFTDVLGIKRAAAKIVPKLLNFEQKEMLTTFNDDTDLLKKVITGDESCVYGLHI